MSKPDWEGIETAYRAGVMSLREIASQHSISHVSINKRAKKEGGEKDLSAKVKAKADALVNNREVSRQVNSKAALNIRLYWTDLKRGHSETRASSGLITTMRPEPSKFLGS
ncbi:hypothetical protein E3AUHO_20770 [Klebsiella pneumoniae subsp. pneumoniae]|uniref:Uncharacterized protein n=1 Tax=Klebsiella pneumoniae TaxID=573 RepID=A0AB74QV29_KLEPN|nr:hypothetical protein [Klebsiella pneumoniae]BDA89391.1 hypothetical protein E3AUHO_20770 [Klebsiella pneumoniae subsp. pneumoniae]EKU3946454.1 hypothetical protein [Klebsiella pneumoniae]EKU8645963.1 hypothetical protein [Klebsiella pneumoniae]EKU8657413.1 hypothetical protein [Klebsiella pneumoniae]